MPKFVDFLNSCHPNLHFTSECETNDSLPFLGTLVFREDDHFSTTIHRKPTFTGLYTNFRSCLPNRYKVGLLNTLIHRAFEICSTYKLFHEELEKLKHYLKANCFDAKLIDSVVKTFLNKRFGPKQPVEHSVPRRNFVIVLPFYGNFTMTVRNTLRKFLSRAYPQVDFRFVFRTIERIGSRFTAKDRLPIDLSSNVIYRFKCRCCDATYIGKTNRHFGVRKGEHIGQSIRTGKPIKPQAESAIFQHCFTTGHKPSEKDFKIIDRAEDYFTTHIREAIQIVINKPILNAQIDQPYLVLLQN